VSTSTNVRWYGPRVLQAVRDQMKRRLTTAGRELVQAVRQNIGTSGPPASLPGGFPHRVSGDLQRSIQMRLDRRSLSLRVVATAPHAEHVEAQRPFLRRTMLAMRPTLRRILLGSGGGSGHYRFTE